MISLDLKLMVPTVLEPTVMVLMVLDTVELVPTHMVLVSQEPMELDTVDLPDHTLVDLPDHTLVD